MLTIMSTSEQNTIDIAKNLSKYLNQDDIVILNGELGAGKTVFMKGFKVGLNIEDDISSPTFTIVNEYHGDFDVFHFDVYRLENGDDFLSCGLEEYFYRGLCIIEWGKIIEDALPKEYLEISISKKYDPDERTLEFIPHGDKYSNILMKFGETI